MLGRKAKDKITGFCGIVTGHCEYLSGCNQGLIVPPVSDDGAFREGQWFDVQRLEFMGDGKIELANDEHPGPDKPAPKH